MVLIFLSNLCTLSCHQIVKSISFYYTLNLKNGEHIEFDNVTFGFIDLKNPRKVLLHKIMGSGKRNLPNYFQYDTSGGGHV